MPFCENREYFLKRIEFRRRWCQACLLWSSPLGLFGYILSWLDFVDLIHYIRVGKVVEIPGEKCDFFPQNSTTYLMKTMAFQALLNSIVFDVYHIFFYGITAPQTTIVLCVKQIVHTLEAQTSDKKSINHVMN